MIHEVRLLGCLEALNVGAQSPENLLVALLLALPHTHALMLLKRLLFSQMSGIVEYRCAEPCDEVKCSKSSSTARIIFMWDYAHWHLLLYYIPHRIRRSSQLC